MYPQVQYEGILHGPGCAHLANIQPEEFRVGHEGSPEKEGEEHPQEHCLLFQDLQARCKSYYDFSKGTVPNPHKLKNDVVFCGTGIDCHSCVCSVDAEDAHIEAGDRLLKLKTYTVGL